MGKKKLDVYLKTKWKHAPIFLRAASAVSLLVLLTLFFQNCADANLIGFMRGASSLKSVQLSGKLSVQIADDFANKKSYTSFLVTDSRSRATYSLVLSNQDQRIASMGNIAEVRGIANSRGEVFVQPGDLKVFQSGKTNAITQGGVTTRKVGVLQVGRNSSMIGDITPGCNPVDLNNKIDGPAGSVNTVYQDITHGQIAFSANLGPTIVLPTYDPGFCDRGNLSWMDTVNSMASAKGFNVADYDHIIYVFPYISTCGFGGYGALGGNFIAINGCNDSRAFTHEVGHNLGMMHASSIDSNGNAQEYGEAADFMGFDYYNPSHVVSTNGPHRMLMGYMPPKDVSAGTYDLIPIQTNSNGQLQVIRVPKNSSEYYYISARTNTGVDVTNTTGVDIHTWAGSNTYLYSRINTGGSFTDSNTGLSITNMGNTSGGGYTVKIAYGGVQPSPTPSPSPTPTQVTCSVEDFFRPPLVTPSNSTAIKRQIATNAAGLSIYVAGTNNGIPISANPIPLPSTPSISTSGGNILMDWYPCSPSGCPVGDYSRTFYLKDSLGNTVCTTTPMDMTVVADGSGNVCTYQSAADVWIVSKVAASDPNYGVVPSQYSSAPVYVNPNLIPNDIANCMDCDYKLNKCVDKGKYYYDTQKVICWAKYERTGTIQSDGTCK